MNAPLVEAAGLGIRFGATAVIDALDLSVEAGTELALTGRSGSGKTTLLLALAGLLPPTAGTVRWPGLATDPAERAAEIGLVFQAPSLLPELTAAENVSLMLRLRGMDRQTAAAVTESALAAVSLAEAADALPAQLSGGQQQRVAVARVIAGRPRLVLADEPTGALDRANSMQVLEVLRDHIRADGGSLIVATHDEDLAALLSEHAAMDDRRPSRAVR